MRSFFFIPATKIENLDLIRSKKVDEIIIDLEDAILLDERDDLISKIFLQSGFDLWYRIPVRDISDSLNLEILNRFIEKGFKKLVIPKLLSKCEYKLIEETFVSIYNDLELIILVEHPKLMVEMSDILEGDKGNNIKAVAIGSHDLMSYMHAKHSADQLYFPRINVLYQAKAYNKISIDIASMNVADKPRFDEEIKFGMEHGFDAKFIIHPKQLEWLQSYDIVKLEQIEWAKKIIAALPKGFAGKEIEPFVLNGEVIEKPHVQKAQDILNQYRYDK